jgi:hypothetical protein
MGWDAAAIRLKALAFTCGKVMKACKAYRAGKSKVVGNEANDMGGGNAVRCNTINNTYYPTTMTTTHMQTELKGE